MKCVKGTKNTYSRLAKLLVWQGWKEEGRETGRKGGKALRGRNGRK